MTGQPIGPRRSRVLDAVRARRDYASREKQTYESPLVHRNGRVGILIDRRSQDFIKVLPDRGLWVDLVALKALLDAL
jgi:hypothetical protein